jgi:hypothetical protein
MALPIVMFAVCWHQTPGGMCMVVEGRQTNTFGRPAVHIEMSQG